MAKVEGIFSLRTMQTYRQTAREFSLWAPARGCKNPNKIMRETLGMYLQQRQKKGMSPSTVSKDMAELNKIYGFKHFKKLMGPSAQSLEIQKNSDDL